MAESSEPVGTASAGPGRGPLLLGGGLALLIAGVVVYLAVAPTPAAPQRATLAGTAEPAPADPMRMVRTDPTGARVLLGATDLGVTPTAFDLSALSAQPLAMTISKPGYQFETRQVTRDADDIAVTLQPITAFVGRWRSLDGSIQELARDGQSVRVVLEAGAGGSQHLRFEFLPGTAAGPVVIAGAVPFIHAAAPTDPTCQLSMASRYEFDPAAGSLILTTEVLQVEMMMGQCVVTGRLPGKGHALARL